MKSTSPFFVRLAYIYVTLPVLIFVAGWCKLPIGLLGGLIILVSLYFTCKNAPALWKPENSDQKRMLLLLALISLTWVFLSGIGALVYQNQDHNTRNTLFEMLVGLSWPVIVNKPAVILTYYIGFWLPSALIGKLAHSVQLGYYMQVVWASLGVFLFFYMLLGTLKRKAYWPVLLFIFFSGLDTVGCLVMGKDHLLIIPWTHMEWYYYPFSQFSSFTTQLFWVFNQAIPLWVTVMLMYHEKNNKSLFFLYACLFLQSTLPAFGLFPFLIYWYFQKSGTRFTGEQFDFTAFFGKLKETIKSSVTLQNTLGALCVVAITFPYLSGNIAGGYHSVTQLPAKMNILHWLAAFFLLEVGLYLLCLIYTQRKNPLYYLCLGCFLIYPFYKIGLGADFCMRGTLAPLVLLFVMIAQTLENADFRKAHRGIFYILIFLLSLGAMTPLHEFTRTIHFTRLGYTKIPPDLFLHNFFGYADGNKFLKYYGTVKPSATFSGEGVELYIRMDDIPPQP